MKTNSKGTVRKTTRKVSGQGVKKSSTVKKTPVRKRENNSVKKQQEKIKIDNFNSEFDLSSDEEIKKLNSVMEDTIKNQGVRNKHFHKISVGKNYHYLTSTKMVSNFFHYLSGKYYVCKGGRDGGGFAPNECEACKLSLDYFKIAKKEKNKKDAKTYKDFAKMISANFLSFISSVEAEAGEDGLQVPEGSVEKLIKMTEYTYHSFFMSRPEVGKKEAIKSLKERCSFIKSNKDLFNRYLNFQKKEGTFGTTSVTASKKTSPKPDYVSDPEVWDEVVLDPDLLEDALKKANSYFESQVSEPQEEEFEDEVIQEDIEEEEFEEEDDSFEEDSEVEDEEEVEDPFESEEDDDEDDDDEDFDL